jgi:hypothetical protein
VPRCDHHYFGLIRCGNAARWCVHEAADLSHELAHVCPAHVGAVLPPDGEAFTVFNVSTESPVEPAAEAAA